MRFGYACPGGHEIIAEFPIGKAVAEVACTEHGSWAARVFDAPHFVEDRRHMKASGPDWSWSIGGPRPKSRAEMRIIEKTKGIEFVSPSEARADAQRLREGKNLDEPAKPPKGYLAKEIAKRGIRFDRSGSAPRQFTREEAERKLKAETEHFDKHGNSDGGWSGKAEAEAKIVTPGKALP